MADKWIQASEAKPGDIVRPNGVLCRVPEDTPPEGFIYVCFTDLGDGWGKPYPWPASAKIQLVRRADEPPRLPR